MTTLLDIPALHPGDDVHHPFLVADIISKGGDHARTTLMLGNRTGRIESAPFWQGRDEAIRGITKGTVVQIVGKVAAYRDARQLDITSLRPLPRGSIPLHELVPSAGPVERYWQFIDDVRQRITAPRLAAVLDLFYADDVFRTRYQECPGAPGIGHHAVLGGLLQHTCEVLSIARHIARVAHADEDVVTAGALLHDIGKIDSYAWDTGAFEVTERGRLIGHVVQGVLMLRHAIACASPEPCNASEQLILEHLILSHHGKQEFGSPVPPATLEAEVLHFADDASAKTASMTEAYQSRELFPDGVAISVRKVWQVDNRWLYRSTTDWGREG
jgi:3'-5' exoribonuclease